MVTVAIAKKNYNKNGIMQHTKKVFLHLPTVKEGYLIFSPHKTFFIMY